MADDTTPLRGYPRPHPDNMAYEDAGGLRSALGMIDADVAAALASVPHAATESAPGLVRLATEADAAAGTDLNAVPSVARTKTIAQAIFAAMVAGAPETLNTIDEIAAALQDNPNVLQAIQDAIATKANSADVTAAIAAAVAGRQPLHANLTALAGQSPPAGANMVPYFAGPTVMSLAQIGNLAWNLIQLDGSRNATFPATINCVDLNYTSDARLKEVIDSLSLDDAVGIIQALEIVTYWLKRDPTERERAGLLAQDVEAVAPSLVTEIDDPDGEFGKIKTVDWTSVTAILLACTQRLLSDHDSLSERIARLEARFGDGK